MESAKEIEVGKVTHYYTKIGVAIIEVTDAIKVGDEIHIKGHTTDFTQKIASMQVEHENVEVAEAGQSIGMAVKEHVRGHDVVYKAL